jgi:hypothetical protein
MALDASAHPGTPAFNPEYTATTLAGTGPADIAGLTDTNLVTPLSSFGYVYGGQALSFQKSMPRIVDPALKAELLAAGLVD